MAERHRTHQIFGIPIKCIVNILNLKAGYALKIVPLLILMVITVHIVLKLGGGGGKCLLRSIQLAYILEFLA